MSFIYRPRPYNGPYPVGNCTNCNQETTCKGKKGNFYCSRCQWHYGPNPKEGKVAA